MALEQNDSLFRALFENSLDPVMVANDERVYVEVNRAACEFYGIPRERLLGMRVDDFGAPGVDVEASWREFLAAGSQQGEFAVQLTSGELRHVVFNATASFSPGLHVSVLRDITEKRRAKDELHALTARLTHVLDSTTDHVFALDRNWRFTYLNGRAARRISGGRDFLGVNIWDTFPGALTDGLHDKFVEAAASDCALHFETFAEEFGGWLEVHAYPLPTGLAVFFRDIGDQKRLEELLARERERLELVLRANNDGIWDCDLVAHSAFVSQRWKSRFGFADGEEPKNLKEFRERIHPDDRPGAAAVFTQHVTSGADTYVTEFRFRCRDESYRWVRAHAVIVRDAGGVPVRTVGSHTDITDERTAAEHVRRQSTILNQVRHSVIATDLQGYITECNRASARVFGIPQGEIPGKHVSCLCDSPGELNALLVRAIQGDLESGADFTCTTPSGIRVDLAVVVSLLRDDSGDPEGFIVCSQDVTEQRRVQQALCSTEEKLQIAQRRAQIGMWEWDFSGRGSISAEYCRLYGLPPGTTSIDQIQWLQMVDPRDRSRVSEEIAGVLHGGASTDMEFRIVRPTGEVRWIADRVSIIRDADGVPLRAFGFITDITERKEAETRLQASERYFRSLIENALDVITVLEEDGTIVYESPSIAKILGYEPSELIGRNSFLFVHPDDVDAALRVFERGRKQPGSVEAMTLRCRHRDGSWRVIEALASNLLHDPAVGAIVINSRDVTQRTITEQRLRESEARLRLAQSAASIGTWEWDIDSNTWRCSKEWVGMHGFGTCGPDCGPWCEVNLPAGHVLGVRVAEALADGGEKPASFEYQLNGCDGSVSWIHSVGKIICDSSGTPVRVTGVSIDNTQRKLHEQQLRESEEKLATAQAIAHVGHWQWDMTTGELHWSDETRRIFGIPRETPLTFEQFVATVYADDYTEFRRGTEEALAKNVPFNLDYRIVRPDGAIRYVNSRGLKIVDSRGNHFVSGIVQDMTERKELEQQLYQAQKMEAMGRLAGGVAHDFNNLLTIVLGYANLVLKKMAPDDPLRTKIVGIREAGERAASVSQQLLAFSRKQLLQPRMLHLNEVVSALQPMLDRLLGDRIRLHVELDPDVQPVKADPSKLDQVLINLTVNARDAMPRGGALHIRTRNVVLEERYALLRSLAPGSYILLTVTDTGEGMDQATMARIFEPFFTTKEQGKGTGLGLATVHGIVEQMGGRVVVFSQKRSGSTFKLYFPSAAAGVEPKSTGTFAAGDEPRGRILVIDPEPGMRSLMRNILLGAGHATIETAALPEAVQLLSEDTAGFDLMILDGALRDNAPANLPEHAANLPILYTCNGNGIPGPDELAAGRDGFVEKPFSAAELVGAVRGILQRGAT